MASFRQRMKVQKVHKKEEVKKAEPDNRKFILMHQQRMYQSCIKLYSPDSIEYNICSSALMDIVEELTMLEQEEMRCMDG